MIKKIAFFVFLLVSVLDIIGIIFKIDSLTFIFKPFILLALLFLYSQSVESRNKWYVMALIFSFFGDVFLLYSGENVFKFGLGFFLIAHLLFIIIVVKRIKKVSILNSFIPIISFGIVLSLLLFLLKDTLRDLLIPVVIYGVVISIFGIVSLIDFLNTKSKKSLLMLLGAIVFIVSDYILAINKFYYEALIFQVAVMVTYISAQYLIYCSMVLDEKKEN
ncbi:lysoplasmalogenase [Lutibacter sp.]|uniref:lysoplasmalogenase n=1 Tax=Lutibacter sp. TaxID=1925666 RepID=UPI00349FE771